MNKRVLIVFFYLVLIIPIVSVAKKNSDKDWIAIDSRKIPRWFTDAKFGIFIHWGLYSVPAWSPKGTYSEWYRYWCDNDTLFGNGDFTGHEIKEYNELTYGKDFPYEGFAPMFKAQDFDAGELADLIKESGAKYAVLTSKHHDGYALWPSMEASRDYGRPWTSTEIGPMRDLVKEYSDSLRDRGIKVGTYLSLREWNNPMYTQENIDEYVIRHFHPQVKDLISNYHPDILWTDGPDKFDENQWRVHDMLTWIYNESPVKDSIVINDRSARWSGKRHADFLCREYSNRAMSPDKPWEECRGIGFSFGYNKNEDIQDYASPMGLIHTLINVVSAGGNLILGIGPDSNGKIPPIMQERLLQIGDWLKVNGEAIYGTKPWKNREQWSEGDRNWQPKGKMYVSGDAILHQTVRPDSGYAVKEVFFTHKGNDLYAILPQYKIGEFVIRDIESTPSGITLLGFDSKLTWRKDGTDIIVELPPMIYGEQPCEYAWTLKLWDAAGVE